MWGTAFKTKAHCVKKPLVNSGNKSAKQIFYFTGLTARVARNVGIWNSCSRPVLL